MQLLFGGYSLDLDRRELRNDSDLVAMEPQVFDVLVHLVQNRDRVVTKDDLFAAVWHGRIVSESTLTSRINAAAEGSGRQRRATGTYPDDRAKGLSLRRRDQRSAGTRLRGDRNDSPSEVAGEPLASGNPFLHSHGRRAYCLCSGWTGTAPDQDRQLAQSPRIRLGKPDLEPLARRNRGNVPANPLRRPRQRPVGLGCPRHFFRSLRT